MFGYIVINADALPKERQQRFRAVYCGLCATLRARHGLSGSATLSYDLTFLAMLLNALYEPGERTGRERCPAHPMKLHDYAVSPVMDYVADMNVALAYHKCLDNWRDDRDLLAAGEGALLKRAYSRIARQWPEKCEAIEAWLQEIHAIEDEKRLEIDPPVNATGRLLGELFACRNDHWADALRAIGDGLGRFIYFMDAYDDLPQDMKKGRYNPLAGLRDHADYEEICRSAMTMMVAGATEAFEALPIVLDYDILSNVLYSGVWSRYAFLNKTKDAPRKGED